MHLVLCYDVVADKRRQRLYKKLQAFLRPVQKSVFEGPLPARRYRALARMVTATIDQETDSVRVYQLCRGCRVLTDHIGTAHAVPHGPEDVVV